ncbi:hypothetical protein LAZ67_X002621 [Cordylochernes scorpioides]|uniref:Reverse transcriptase domain-containing protein n=1 Tax=Cordylochernes scorpioides TaxID=51811 RepID=A0ABY6LUL2_9ARAC|nr:hypothetical protein LAZ67_X002621 [Cordylochernes scorpioides]
MSRYYAVMDLMVRCQKVTKKDEVGWIFWPKMQIRSKRSSIGVRDVGRTMEHNCEVVINEGAEDRALSVYEGTPPRLIDACESKPNTFQLIEATILDLPNDAIVVAECQKFLLLERELMSPSSVISLSSNREESDKRKIAFITPDGLYQFEVMPFELCNAPTTFKRQMANLLKDLKWTTCLCYLDDVIVLSDTFEEHL